jgi:ribosomal protein S18 acetylase RimI-like enzyme
MDVRALREADAAAWLALRLEGLESEPNAFGMTAAAQREISVAAIAARFRDMPAGDATLGAFIGDELVGIATFRREAGEKDQHKGRIYGVYVAVAHRRAGIGRALLSALIAGARQHAAVEQILLAVTTTQTAARELYRALGFTTFGTEPRALKDGATYLDEDHMILFLR